MNTEKFCVFLKKGRKVNSEMPDIYYNRIFDFEGTLEQCNDFARQKGFGGGVEILTKRKV